MTPRLERYLVALLETRRGSIETVAVLTRPWPPELAPEAVPWRTRTRNAILRAGLLNPRSLAHVTFGDLLALRAMGTKSVLDFACTLEALLGLAMEVGVPVDDLVIATIDSPWADMVSDEDPRFSDLLPPGRGTVFERLDAATLTDTEMVGDAAVALIARALPAIWDRVAAVEEAPLDEALRNYIRAISGEDGVRLDALLARLGCDGQPPRTLEEASRMIGVTRERMRQIQTRVRGRRPSHPAYMPALDKALSVIAELAPADARTAAQALKRQGISVTLFHPWSVLAAAEFCGRTGTFEVEALRKGQRVVTTPTLAHAGGVTSVAARQADSSGVSNTAEVAAALSAEGVSMGEAHVQDILTNYSDAEFLDGQWFWMPKRAPFRNRLHNVTRSILSVASPLDVGTIREGARRRYRWRRVSLVPPRDILLAFYRAHPAFTVEEDGRIGSAAPLDYRVELGATDRILVDVLRMSPTGVLDRTSFEEACMARGMNQSTFSVYTTCAPVLDHLGTDVWALRGVRVDPAAVEALRQANAQRPRERRVQDYGWTGEGNLWVGVRLPRTTSLVIGIPSPILGYVAEQRFAARAEDGSDAGLIVVSDSGSSWGYGPYLSRRGADEGDILRIEFDLAQESATLRLGGEELLEA